MEMRGGMSQAVEVAGIPVRFPHAPYGVQLVFMDHLVRALEAGGNALLESPTGTGKTLALLCGALAWQQRHPAHKIVYASRTHAQLAQVLAELRRSGYRPATAMLGARDQLCGRPDVRGLGSSGATAAVCARLVQKKECEQYARVADSLGAWTEQLAQAARIPDLEDLGTFGAQHRACPYFLARRSVETADLVLAPYNYLTDARSRRELGLADAVVIFDEAHNLVRRVAVTC
jgi:regulator of telomere elongation helicase 1